MSKQFIAPTVKSASLARMDPSQGFAVRCVVKNKDGSESTVIGSLNIQPEEAAPLVAWLQSHRNRRAVESKLQLMSNGDVLAAWMSFDDMLFLLKHRHPCSTDAARITGQIDSWLRGFAAKQGVNTAKWIRELAGRGRGCDVLLMTARHQG